jgi:hypothetical protein
MVGLPLQTIDSLAQRPMTTGNYADRLAAKDHLKLSGADFYNFKHKTDSNKTKKPLKVKTLENTMTPECIVHEVHLEKKMGNVRAIEGILPSKKVARAAGANYTKRLGRICKNHQEIKRT